MPGSRSQLTLLPGSLADSQARQIRTGIIFLTRSESQCSSKVIYAPPYGGFHSLLRAGTLAHFSRASSFAVSLTYLPLMDNTQTLPATWVTPPIAC